MSQTTYDAVHDEAFAGMPADSAPGEIHTLSNEEVAAIPFGVAIAQGATDAGGKLPASALDRILGIALHTFANDNIGLVNTPLVAIKPKAAINVMRDGGIKVLVEEAVLKGDEAYVRIADGVADVTRTQKGAFRKSTDSGTAVRLRGAFFRNSVAADKFAIVDLEPAATKGDALDVPIPFGAITANTSTKEFKVRPDRFFVVEKARLYDFTGLAASGVNYVAIKLKNGATVLATWSTQTGQQGTITADTWLNMVLNGTPANLVLAPDADLTLEFTVTGAPTLPAGKILLEGRYI